MATIVNSYGQYQTFGFLGTHVPYVDALGNVIDAQCASWAMYENTNTPFTAPSGLPYSDKPIHEFFYIYLNQAFQSLYCDNANYVLPAQQLIENYGEFNLTNGQSSWDSLGVLA